MKKNAITRIEELKQEFQAAVDGGQFASMPADGEGITPQTRLQWAVDSVVYIQGVAAGLPKDKVDEAVAGLKATDEDELAMSYVGVVEVLSGDMYVSEGKYNISRAMELLNDEGTDDDSATADEDDTADGEAESLWDKAKKKFAAGKGKKSKPKAKTPPKQTRGGDSGDNEAELRELKIRIAKMEAAKADADSRAEKAEAEVKALKNKLQAMGINT